MFRKFLTFADVSNYFYAKSTSLIVFAEFACASSSLTPISFIDLPLYYSIHVGMALSILSVFGIKMNEVDVKRIMMTNGTNLGGKYKSKWKVTQSTGIKIILNAGKLASDAVGFIPFLGIIGRGTDVAFNFIDTSVLGKI